MKKENRHMSNTTISPTQVWLITGSTRGLGRALAQAVLEAGHNLVATGRNPEQLQDLVALYGDKVRAITLDVTSEQAAASAVAEAIKFFGRLDVVANNAGYAMSVRSKIPAWPSSERR
jgi:NAD(P)-dependent dehydrogenase (short-subunit alcohol dehydrogenase family)